MSPWRRCGDRLVCPVCDDVLEAVERSLQCPGGHTFDVARQGYVDLLPAGHGRSKLQGDTREMVRARGRFLERGHYRAVSDALNRAARGAARSAGSAGRGADPPVLLEAGCGEGYYVGRLARAVGGAAAGRGDGGGGCAFGLDVSREALRLAARSHPDIAFFINDVKHGICLADRSVDVLLDVFAPRNPGEFGRVVRPGGMLLVVLPLHDHLRELRASVPLLGMQPDKRRVVEAQLEGAFHLASVERVVRGLSFSREDVLDVLRMTPNYWHTDEEERARASDQGGLEVTLAVEVLRFRRKAAG